METVAVVKPCSRVHHGVGDRVADGALGVGGVSHGKAHTSDVIDAALASSLATRRSPHLRLRRPAIAAEAAELHVDIVPIVR